MQVKCSDGNLRQFGYKEVPDPDGRFEKYNVVALVCDLCREIICYEPLNRKKKIELSYHHICKNSKIN